MITLFLLGVLAALSPCPLTTNAAAVGFISHNTTTHSYAWISIIAYLLGRIAAYVVLGALLSAGLTAAPELAFWAQEKLPILLGPALMFVGIILLGWISLPSLGKIPERNFSQKILEGTQLGGAFVLGFLFAFALCPPSAAIFFGSVIPIALSSESYAWQTTAIFGAGTALPVIVTALLLKFGSSTAKKIFRGLPKFLSGVQSFAGALFLLLGIYWTFSKII